MKDVRDFLAFVDMDQRQADEICLLATVFRICRQIPRVDHLQVSYWLHAFHTQQLFSNMHVLNVVRRDQRLYDCVMAALQLYERLPPDSPRHRLPWLVQLHLASLRAELGCVDVGCGQSKAEPKPEAIPGLQPSTQDVTGPAAVQTETMSLLGSATRPLPNAKTRRRQERRREQQQKLQQQMEQRQLQRQQWEHEQQLARALRDRWTAVLHELRCTQVQARRKGIRRLHWHLLGKARQRDVHCQRRLQMKLTLQLHVMWRVTRARRLAIRTLSTWRRYVWFAQWAKLHLELNLLQRCTMCLQLVWRRIKQRLSNPDSLLASKDVSLSNLGDAFVQLLFVAWSRQLDLLALRELCVKLRTHDFPRLLRLLLAHDASFRGWSSTSTFMDTLLACCGRLRVRIASLRIKRRPVDAHLPMRTTLVELHAMSPDRLRVWQRSSVHIPRFFAHLPVHTLHRAIAAWLDEADRGGESTSLYCHLDRLCEA